MLIHVLNSSFNPITSIEVVVTYSFGYVMHLDNFFTF